MIKPGLVSITFRKLSPEEILSLCNKAHLNGIEWGGDIHVPPGDIRRAQEVGKMTCEAGMEVAAYGSYYRLGGDQPDALEPNIEAAAALGTRIIRLWPGTCGSKEAGEAERQKVANDCRRAAEMAASAGLSIACEWHGGTLTDDTQSAVQLLEEVNHPAFRTYWQPHRLMPPDQCMTDLQSALPYVVGLHVFQWHLATGDRLPLSDGTEIWNAYLTKSKTAGDMFALLEFVKDDSPSQFLDDAACLKSLLADLPDQ